MSDAAPSEPAWDVICLCAQWCGTCREFRAPFDHAMRAHRDARLRWVDIEDEADALGDVEIETFPTLLIAHRGQVRFLGPVLPQLAQLDRLLESLQSDPKAVHVEDLAEAQALFARIQLIGATRG